MPAKDVRLLDNLHGTFFTLLHDHEKYRHIEISKSDERSRASYSVISWPGHISITSERGCFVFASNNGFAFNSSDVLVGAGALWSDYVLAGNPHQWSEEKARLYVTGLFDEWAKGQLSASFIVKQRERLESEVLAYAGNEPVFMQKVTTWWPGALGADLHKSLIKLNRADLLKLSDDFIWSCSAIAWAANQYKSHKELDSGLSKELDELASVVMTRGQIESLYEQTPGDDDDQSYAVSLVRHKAGEKAGQSELIAYDTEYPDEGYFSLDERASTDCTLADQLFQKLQRLSHANDLIQVIAAHGRRFFFSPARNTFAFFDICVDSSLWFVDDYTGKRMSPLEQGRWEGFSHGGTLKELVQAMADYIVSGQRIPISWIATPRSNPDNGDIWGYGTEASASVRAAAEKLPIIDAGGA